MGVMFAVPAETGVMVVPTTVTTDVLELTYDVGAVEQLFVIVAVSANSRLVFEMLKVPVGAVAQFAPE